MTPSILKEGSLWRMWYISGVRWVEIEGRYEPIYVIKYATSQDGIDWSRPNHQCIMQSHEHEAFSHPSVIKDGTDIICGIVSVNSRNYRDGAGSYRIGYAKSPDGLAWERMDKSNGLDVSSDGWDSTMTCYPFVLAIDGQDRDVLQWQRIWPDRVRVRSSRGQPMTDTEAAGRSNDSSWRYVQSSRSAARDVCELAAAKRRFDVQSRPVRPKFVCW